MSTDKTTDTAPSDPDDLQRFTAIGRPMPKQDYTSYGGFAMGGGSFVADDPNRSLPFKFKDSDFISVAVKQAEIDDVLGTSGGASANDTDSLAASESPLLNASSGAEGGRRRSFLGMLGKKGAGDGGKKAKKDAFRMVKITRGEYLMYFAKGDNGEYTGTAPEGDPGRKEVLRVRLADEKLQDRGRQDVTRDNYKGKQAIGNIVGGGLGSGGPTVVG